MSQQVIAIVDDDASVRAGLGLLLKSCGYRTETFALAEDFLQSDVIERTSCLITDVKMPRMTGIELQQSLISCGHRCPVIFMTAFPEESPRLRALAAGARGVFAKPCDAQSLIKCIEAALPG